MSESKEICPDCNIELVDVKEEISLYSYCPKCKKGIFSALIPLEMYHKIKIFFPKKEGNNE